MRRLGQHHVRLDDGTTWSVDRERDSTETSLEWVLRYGSRDEVYALRLDIASVVASYKALLFNTQKRRNEVARELLNALDEWETQAPRKAEDG